MTTPTPRTDAIALDRNDSHRHPDCSDRIVGWTDYEALRDRSREIERDLAARDAELAEVHILDNEEESRTYIDQLWAEAMTIYNSGNYKLAFSPAMQETLQAHQQDFM